MNNYRVCLAILTVMLPNIDTSSNRKINTDIYDFNHALNNYQNNWR